jgi:peroxiredoxin
VSGIWVVAFVALWMVVILLGLVQLGILRRVAPLVERAETTLREAARATLRGLRPGEAVPDFTAGAFGGGTFTESDLRGSTTIVLFLNTGCQSCEVIAADIEAGRVPDLGVPLVVVADEPDEAARFADGGQVQVVLQENGSLARVFESDRTPHAFVIDETGRVLVSGSPNNWDVMVSLLEGVERGGDRELDVAAARMVS